MSRRIAIIVGVVLAVALPAWGQTQITTGVIQGTVSDQSGALVPGATSRSGMSTPIRRARRPPVPMAASCFCSSAPAAIRVTVSLQGFATHVQEDVTLTVGQSVTLNPVLKVSGTAETVTVTGSSLIDVTRTEVSNTLNETTISTTPILGRKFEDLLTLTPGVSIVQGPDGDEITFSGQRGMYNNVSLDGGDYNNGFFGEQLGGQRAAIDITLEAVKEFQVVASGANAEFGRTAGGVVNVITKSGTNDLHGSLFHFQRLEGLTADASDGTPPTDFHREQFGGTMGGPIKRDRMFFFVALEHINENLQRANLSQPLGTCGVDVPVITNPAHEALINGSTECQRLRAAQLLPHHPQSGRRQPDRPHHRQHGHPGKGGCRAQPVEQPERVLQLRLLQERQPDLRCGHLRQFRQRHRGPVEDQRLQPEFLHDAFLEQVQRVPRDLRAGTAAAQRRRVQRSARHGHGRSRISLRQSLLPAPERRRVALADADQEQLVDRGGTPHVQSRRRVAPHGQRSGLPWLLQRPLPVRHA